MQREIGGRMTAPDDFRDIVMICIDERWEFITNARDAVRCLSERFADTDGPSYRRALQACEALASGQGTPDAAQSTFVVAAMAAGYPFDVDKGSLAAMEDQVAAAAEVGLLGMLENLERDQNL